MELETLTVIMAIAGLTMLYGAVTNRNPLEVIKLAVTGGDVTQASQLSTPSPGLFTEVIAGTAHADPAELHSDGTPRLFPDGSPRYINDPKPQDLPAGDPRKVFKAVPAAGSAGDPRAPVDARR